MHQNFEERTIARFPPPGCGPVFTSVQRVEQAPLKLVDLIRFSVRLNLVLGVDGWVQRNGSRAVLPLTHSSHDNNYNCFGGSSTRTTSVAFTMKAISNSS